MGVGRHLPRCVGGVGVWVWLGLSVGQWTSECVHCYSRCAWCAWVRIVLMWICSCTGMYVCTVRTTVRS